MMQAVAVVSVNVHEEALRAAGGLSEALILSTAGYNTPVVDEIVGWVDRIWEQVNDAIHAAWSTGYNAANEYAVRARTLFAEATRQAQDRISEITTILLDRLNAYAQLVIDGALRRIKPELLVGERKLALTTISVDQKVKVGPSFEAALTEICKFAAEGELSVGAKYGLAEAE